MQNIDTWLFLGTPPPTVLRKRPMALSIFEKHGLDPWHPDYQTISELCASRKIPMEAFFAEMKSLPMPDAGNDWKIRPIYELLDFLTREHADLMNGPIAEITQVLSGKASGDTDSRLRLQSLVMEWPEISSSLLDHMQEEEAFLFPKILQYDHCLRHKACHPDFTGGSVNVFVAIRMLDNEKRQLAGIRRFLNEVLFSRAACDIPGSLESRLEPLLESLQTRLLDHSGIETNVLFPMAKAVEKALMDVRISGVADGKIRPQVSNLI